MVMISYLKLVGFWVGAFFFPPPPPFFFGGGECVEGARVEGLKVGETEASKQNCEFLELPQLKHLFTCIFFRLL